MKVEKILLVDDEPFIRKLCELTLTQVGRWQVMSADGGAGGLKLASEKCPDLILLDIRMPGMDGIETLAALKKGPKTSQIPVIFVTASIQRHEMDKYKQLGVAGVITKPFDPMKLPAEITAILAESASVGEQEKLDGQAEFYEFAGINDICRRAAEEAGKEFAGSAA